MAAATRIYGDLGDLLFVSNPATAKRVNDMDRISPKEYSTEVAASVELARKPTGWQGGRVAAQALLSAYNVDHFQLDVTLKAERVVRLCGKAGNLNLIP